VRPKTGGLTFAEGTVPTVKGLITTRWEKQDNGQFSLSVHVPASTRATVYVPKLINSDFLITESGKRIWPAQSTADDPGVLAISEDDACIKCLVASGDYHFGEKPSNP